LRRSPTTACWKLAMSGFYGGVGGGIEAGEEGFAAGFGFGAEIVELDVAENGGLDS
jgi:hypothetical protein